MPVIRTVSSRRNGQKRPIALLPPPTQATSKSGRRLLTGQYCRPRFLADHQMKIAHHHRIRMRSVSRAEDIMGGADVGHPIAHRFIDRFFQRLLSGRHFHDFRAEHLHPGHIERLPLRIHRAHIDHALEAGACRDGRGGHAMLSRAGLGDDPPFAHPLGEDDLAQGVVDFVRAGVQTSSR